MFVRIGNTPRDYAWGSTSAIADLLGTVPAGGPEAELWLGAHPGSPSVILDRELTGGASTLEEWIAGDPQAALGTDSPTVAARGLPFLLKVLAAESPLSLQAHPSAEQAVAGFARENALGIPLDSPDRSYKDASPKPELIYVLSERFDALCGFRDLQGTLALFAELGQAGGVDERGAIASFSRRLADDGAPEAQALRAGVAWLLGGGTEVGGLVRSVVAASAHAVVQSASGRHLQYELEFETVGRLARAYPGDPGIVLSLLLNRVVLRPGDVLYLPAGNIHAYLNGLGIELMSASDNVLRGGLTPKHIDVPELLSVLSFDPVPVPMLRADVPEPGVQVFRPDVPDFALTRVDLTPAIGDADVRIDGPAIGLCTSGALELSGAHGSHSVVRGDAVYITPDEDVLHIVGAGSLFLATENSEVSPGTRAKARPL